MAVRYLTTILLALVATTANAQDRGFYIGAGAGSSDLETNLFDVVLPSEPPQFVPTKVDDSDSGWRGYLGYRFGPNFGFEVAYTDLGDFLYEDFDLNYQTNYGAESTDVSLVGFLPLGNGRVDLFAKIGAAFWDIDATTGPIATPLVDPGFGVNPDSSGTDLTWSVGINVNLLASKRLHLRGEYAVYDEITDLDKLRYFGVSIGYLF